MFLPKHLTYLFNMESKESKENESDRQVHYFWIARHNRMDYVPSHF